MLIVIEGLDGSGKSTQVSRVLEYLTERESLEPRYLHFPRFDAPVVGELIARFLRGEFGRIEAVHPSLVALLFAEDRRDAAGIIRDWLQEGRTVLLDRYVYSNIAFQCAKLQDAAQASELRDWILKTEYEVYGIPKPDVNIFLDVPETFVRERLSDRHSEEDREYLQGGRDIHEADMTFQHRVRQVYLELCGIDQDFLRVDCADSDGQMLPVETVFRKIENHLKTKQDRKI